MSYLVEEIEDLDLDELQSMLRSNRKAPKEVKTEIKQKMTLLLVEYTLPLVAAISVASLVESVVRGGRGKK